MPGNTVRPVGDQVCSPWISSLRKHNLDFSSAAAEINIYIDRLASELRNGQSYRGVAGDIEPPESNRVRDYICGTSASIAKPLVCIKSCCGLRNNNSSGGNSYPACRTRPHRPPFHPRRQRFRRHVDRPPSPVRREIRITLQVPLDRAHAHPELVRDGLFSDEPLTQRNILPLEARAEIF
jgi:hypothetical protein